MAKSRAQIATSIATNLANNTSGAITPTLLRSTLTDIAAAAPNTADADGFIGGGGGSGGAPTIVSVSYSPTLATNAAQAPASCPLVVQVGALTGNILISNPTSPTNRQKLEFVLVQDATGGRTLTLDTKFRFPSSSSLSGTISASNSPDFAVANKKTILLCEYDLTDDKWSVVSFVPGY